MKRFVGWLCKRLYGFKDRDGYRWQISFYATGPAADAERVRAAITELNKNGGW